MDFHGTMPLWEPQWTAERLRKRHAEVGDRAFNQGYRMRAFADSERTFRHLDVAVRLGRDEPAPGRPYPEDWRLFLGVDLSTDKRPGNCLFLGAVDQQMVYRPVRVEYLAASSPLVARRVNEIAHQDRVELVMVETNAYQAALREWMHALPEQFPYWGIVDAFTTGSNKHHEQLGLPGLDVEFEHGAWRIPGGLFRYLTGKDHPLECDCGACRWRAEMHDHPHHATSDGVMACWLFRQAVRRWLGRQLPAGVPEFVEPRVDGSFFDTL